MLVPVVLAALVAQEVLVALVAQAVLEEIGA